jgi:hypothetical protein
MTMRARINLAALVVFILYIATGSAWLSIHLLEPLIGQGWAVILGCLVFATTPVVFGAVELRGKRGD